MKIINKFCIIATVFACIIDMAVIACLPVCAADAQSPADSADCVAVECQSSERDTFCGVMPDVLKAVSAMLAVIGIVAIISVCKKKHNSPDELFDKRTGIGNAKYYNYVFEQLVFRRSISLYAVVYLAAGVEEIASKHGEKAIEVIEKYAASCINTAIAHSEYSAKIENGVFALLVKAPSEQECKSRALAVVDSLNCCIHELYPETADAFRAGVLRMCEHSDCDAEAALYNAKQGYLAALRSNTFVEITCEAHLIQGKKQKKLRQSVSKAVADGEFQMYMQFIVENKTQKICGAEVLSRWQNSEYGILRPSEYIGSLKETEQIVPHDYKMFSAVCRQLEAWSTEPYDNLFLTCNFTRISLGQCDFSSRIAEIADGFEFDRRRLIIEITEDFVAKNSTVVAENICKCRKMGFKIAIDDMGTGFSSFADLYYNEIDAVKIDSEFLARCSLERQRTMLSSTVSLIHSLNAAVIFEGIEKPEQAEFLDSIDCDMMQGFLFSKVVPQTECAEFLKTQKICEKFVLEK